MEFYFTFTIKFEELIDINDNHLDNKKKDKSYKKKHSNNASDPAKMFFKRNLDSKAKSKDIQLRSVDVGFAGHQLIKDANLTIAFGRRYGLVGRVKKNLYQFSVFKIYKIRMEQENQLS